MWILEAVPLPNDSSRTGQFLCTDTGAVRSRNEDALLALPEFGLWVVCDGMGGHDAGDYASRNIVSRLQAARFPAHPGGRVRIFEQCLRQSNADLVAYTHSNNFDCVGSTAVGLMLQYSRATVVWVGDSRAYRLRDHRIRLISRDHSVAEENADRGVSIEDEHSGAITRAIGVTPEVEIDLMSSQSLSGDIWLLCSDGVSGSLEECAMAEIMQNSPDPARDLVDQAIDQGSRDNCTAIVIRLEE